ncbi:MAG TPA: hypothetical protein IAA15_00710, partial [Candidatus Olsenella pullicola]|nr:hypothetical protein [Candidatus Olsenella pullicola]
SPGPKNLRDIPVILSNSVFAVPAPSTTEACDEGTFETVLPEGVLTEATDVVVSTAEFMDALRGQAQGK